VNLAELSNSNYLRCSQQFSHLDAGRVRDDIKKLFFPILPLRVREIITPTNEKFGKVSANPSLNMAFETVYVMESKTARHFSEHEWVFVVPQLAP